MDLSLPFIKKKEKKKEIPSEEEPEFVEYNEEAFKEERKVRVKVEKLNEYRETEKIQQLLREGYIVFLRIKELRKKDINELKRAVDKLKRTVEAMNGDIVGVDEDYIVLTPTYAQIYRGGR